MGKLLQAPRKHGFGPIGRRPEPTIRSLPAKAGQEVAPERRPVNYTGPIADLVAERDLPTPPTVSVICPTYNREAMHEKFYQVFHNQDYALKDLWILDDTYTPSRFFSQCTDPEVHYVHMPQKRTIGAKRNQLITMSSGSVVAHFDDDDWYARTYLSSMVDAMVRTNADLVKLSMWKEHRPSDNHRRVFDARRRVHGDMWGWGFSYVYRRYAATCASFPHINSGEDYAFVTALQKKGLKTVQVDGGIDWVEHVLHGRNSSRKQ